MRETLFRRPTVSVPVGRLVMGSQSPIYIQSMTNTDTADVIATVQQIQQLADAGSELIRVTVNSEAAAKSVPEIVARLREANYWQPIIGDFHFNGHRLLEKYPACAEALDKLRINPGNVGRGKKKDEQFALIVGRAIEFNKPVRIGVNWGSLDQAVLARLMDENAKRDQPLTAAELMREAMIVSALESVLEAKRLGLTDEQIILSVKVSDVQDLVAVYQSLASQCHYPLHLGLTEAGMGTAGIVASSTALAILLQQGIGDTIRISLTPEPGGLRTQEVKVAQEILQSLGLRAFTPKITACPGCGRTSSTYFQQLTIDIQQYVNEKMSVWREQYPDKAVESLKVAVMGCVVNGPGESKLADIGISLPGTGELPVAPVYEDGQKTVTLKGDNIASEFKVIIDQYIARRYG